MKFKALFFFGGGGKFGMDISSAKTEKNVLYHIRSFPVKKSHNGQAVIRQSKIIKDIFSLLVFNKVKAYFLQI